MIGDGKLFRFIWLLIHWSRNYSRCGGENKYWPFSHIGL